MRRRIIKVARQVRRWAVRNRRRYHTSIDLHCMCAITAFRLFTKLKEAGLQDTAVCITPGDDHAFVSCGEYVVDVTATQFDAEYKAVEVRTSKEAREHNQWEVEKELRTVTAIRAHFVEWPDIQQPSPLYTKSTIHH